MESDRKVPEMHAEARKGEEKGFPGEGMMEVYKERRYSKPAVFLPSVRFGFF